MTAALTAPLEPTVSVIMATRNSARFLEAAMASVLGQTLQDLELIVADDASTDASLAIARRIETTDPRVRVIPGEALSGPGAARNRALEVAHGRFIAVVDSDDLMRSERLEALVRLAEAKRADAVADNLALFDVDPHTPFATHLRVEPGAQARAVDCAAFIAANCMYGHEPNLGFLKPVIRRAALERIHLRYDPQLRVGEDFDLLARLLVGSGVLWVDPRPLYLYRKHAQSTSRRLRPQDLQALLEADARFVRAFDPAPGPLKRALRRRRRSLLDALAYETAVAALKARAPARAIASLLSRPSAAPLLSLPIRNRLSGRAARRRQSAIAAEQLASPFREPNGRLTDCSMNLQSWPSGQASSACRVKGV